MHKPICAEQFGCWYLILALAGVTFKLMSSK
uniref:Uncharacterized protein n=1 Tax=Arundo donax TaxID=35708 RepID=A0A0A9H441_ARUDO